MLDKVMPERRLHNPFTKTEYFVGDTHLNWSLSLNSLGHKTKIYFFPTTAFNHALLYFPFPPLESSSADPIILWSL